MARNSGIKNNSLTIKIKQNQTLFKELEKNLGPFFLMTKTTNKKPNYTGNQHPSSAKSNAQNSSKIIKKKKQNKTTTFKQI